MDSILVSRFLQWLCKNMINIRRSFTKWKLIHCNLQINILSFIDFILKNFLFGRARIDFDGVIIEIRVQKFIFKLIDRPHHIFFNHPESWVPMSTIHRIAITFNCHIKWYAITCFTQSLKVLLIILIFYFDYLTRTYVIIILIH